MGLPYNIPPSLNIYKNMSRCPHLFFFLSFFLQTAPWYPSVLILRTFHPQQPWGGGEGAAYQSPKASLRIYPRTHQQCGGGDEKGEGEEEGCSESQLMFITVVVILVKCVFVFAFVFNLLWS